MRQTFMEQGVYGKLRVWCWGTGRVPARELFLVLWFHSQGYLEKEPNQQLLPHQQLIMLARLRNRLCPGT